jgi:hypothetical protein
MNRVAARSKPGLWALDAALLLLGMMVLLMVLRLLRFDDPNPLYNAWLYILGVPTTLIGTSMITRVLANDTIEKSIQFGFLLSVGAHLLLVFLAAKVVLFRSFWPNEIQGVAVVTPASKFVAPQYFQPAGSISESRPDYLKPVMTEQNAEQSMADLTQRIDESAKLNIDVVQDEIKPTLADKPFNKPRKEPSPSQPTISSTAERLERPDPNKTLDRTQSEIEVPSLASAQPAPSQEMQAAAAELNRTDVAMRSSNALTEMPSTKLNIESRTNQGTQQGVQKSSKVQDERSTNRELEKALNRTASDLPERPSLLQRGSRETMESDKPTVANVPVPKLGTPSAKTTSDSPSERDTEMRSRSNDSRASARQSVDMSKLQNPTRFEPNPGRTSTSSGQGTSQRKDTTPSLSDNSFLADPRLALDDVAGRQRPDRPLGDSMSVPATRQPIPIAGGASSDREYEPNTLGDLEQAMSIRGENGKSDLAKRPTGKRPFAQGSLDMSLNPTLGAPSIELGRDAWAAPLLDSPRKGLDPNKRDFALPEIRETDIAIDRLRRPETGGPRIANSTVPIPAAAFSQRLQRNLEQVDSATDLGQLGPQTEQAIESGLQFLAKYQRADGSWHLGDFGETVDIRSESAATALALLSFQGAGYTHQQFKYENTCKKALTWLIQNQRPNGDLYVRTDLKSDSNAWLYSHGIATLAVCEAYGMTQDESIKDNAQRAVRFLVESQDPLGGGWRYQPRIGSDTSVTGWCMMALKSAELSGLEVSKESYRRISKWLDGSQASDTQKYLFRYNWQAPDMPATRHGRVTTPVMTSVGLLMRLYLGWRRDNPDMQRGTDWLADRLPAEGTSQNPQRDTYYWYYATQVMFHMGGERWKKWYENLYPLLIRSQNKNGEYVGSWDPNGRIPDAWGRFGGRLYVTTLNLLSLEVYYRHLPIYEATAD